MASDNDKIGSWQNVSIDIPDFLEDLRENINEVAEFLLLILDIALAVLNIVRVFVATFLNPIGALIQAIIDEINALILDLRQIGLYIAGDWNLLEYPFSDLRGGFPEYERRMLARLTDRTDPTRPEVSSRIQVVSIFLYISADATQAARIVKFVRSLLKFFNQELPTGSLPTPVIRDVKYGVDGVGLTNWRGLAENFSLSTTPPNSARVSWTVFPPRSKNPLTPFPTPPPEGFLISVSTVAGGIPVFYDRPRTADVKKPSRATNEQIQPRNYGPALDTTGRPIVLFGGADEIDFPNALSWNRGTVDGNPNDGSSRVYGVLDATATSPIPLDLLRVGGTTYLQKIFKIETSGLDLLTWQSQGFTIELNRDQLPRDATYKIDSDGKVEVEDLGFATTYYVRIASLADGFAPPQTPLRYDFNAAALNGDTDTPFTVPLSNGGEIQSARSPWSDPVELTYPNANTKAYLESLQIALMVLILCRADLPLIDEVLGKSDAVLEAARNHLALLPNVALQPTGLEDFKDLFNQIFEDFQQEAARRGSAPGYFRKDLFARVRTIANEMYRRTGPLPQIEAQIVDATEELRTITWFEILNASSDSRIRRMGSQLILEGLGDLTLLESLTSTNYEVGVGLGLYGLGIEDTVVETWSTYSDVILGRKPHFIEVSPGEGDETFQPVLQATPEETQDLIVRSSPGLQTFYERYIQPGGSLLVDNEAAGYLITLANLPYTIGSADDSPVFYVGRRDLVNAVGAPSSAGSGAAAFCRTLFAEAPNNVVYAQSRTVLTLAASVLRRPANDGQWIALRLFDFVPAIEDFLEIINRWIRAINEALKGIAEAILAVINFLESRIIELQQLIRRINALLQSLLLISFPVGGSALMLVSNGTGGVISDLITAENKPQDGGPLTYGAGIAVVAPLAPAFLVDLFFLSDDPNDPQLQGPTLEGAFTPEALPPAQVDLVPEDEEPDVL